MDIVFVILHFKTFEDTIACIESIRERIDSDNYSIIVVDNGSNNGSYEILSQKYKDSNDVILIKNEMNMGFAKGLNIGIEYANRNMSPAFVAAINNDTQIVSRNVVEVLYKKYEKYGFSLFGPMIITRDGSCSTNPIRNTLRSKQEVYEIINRYKKILIIIKFRMFSVYSLLQKLKARTMAVKVIKYPMLVDCMNYKLHGSFLVFSQDYFKKFGGFDERTFIYGEEDILYLNIIKNGLKTLYSPEMVIYHKEDSSTTYAMPNTKRKMAFVCENCIDSLEKYLGLLECYEKENTDAT